MAAEKRGAANSPSPRRASTRAGRRSSRGSTKWSTDSGTPNSVGRSRARPLALAPFQRRHEASSTIQLNKSPNECPACAAISGTSDVGVMPGWVLTSSQMSSPFSEWRSS